jgi:hypothetical protein
MNVALARTVKVRRATDHLPTPGPQIAKPIRLLAVQQRDDESPVASECKEGVRSGGPSVYRGGG